MFTDQQIPDILLRILILGPVSLVWIALVVRGIGLRSFSKMTAFDFITTIATGSLLGSAATAETWPAFLVANGTILALLGTQALIAFMRMNPTGLVHRLENEPILLMRDGEIYRANLRRTRVTEEDLVAKLREANVLDFSHVRAVVLETTGDISVIHGSHVDERLISQVRGS